MQDLARILQESCKMMHSVARFLQDSCKILQDNRPQSTRGETFALRVYLDIFKLFKLIESHKDSEIFLGMVS